MYLWHCGDRNKFLINRLGTLLETSKGCLNVMCVFKCYFRTRLSPVLELDRVKVRQLVMMIKVRIKGDALRLCQ